MPQVARQRAQSSCVKRLSLKKKPCVEKGKKVLRLGLEQRRLPKKKEPKKSIGFLKKLGKRLVSLLIERR